MPKIDKAIPPPVPGSAPAGPGGSGAPAAAGSAGEQNFWTPQNIDSVIKNIRDLLQDYNNTLQLQGQGTSLQPGAAPGASFDFTALLKTLAKLGYGKYKVKDLIELATFDVNELLTYIEQRGWQK